MQQGSGAVGRSQQSAPLDVPRLTHSGQRVKGTILSDSTSPDLADANGEESTVVIRRGRGSVPYCVLPTWVALAGLPGQAQAAYWQLALHLSTQRTDRDVWPTRSSLARRLRLRRPQSVDPYLDVLVEIGAIEKRTERTGTNRMRKRLVITVHFEPPADYTGPMSLADLDEDDEESAKPQVAPVVRSTASPVVRSTASPVVRSTAQELITKGTTNHRNNQPASAVDVTSGTESGRLVGGEEGEHDKAAAVLASLPVRTPLPASTVRTLAPHVADLLASGWTPGELTEHWTTGLPASYGVGLLIQRVRDTRARVRPSTDDLEARIAARIEDMASRGDDSGARLADQMLKTHEWAPPPRGHHSAAEYYNEVLPAAVAQFIDERRDQLADVIRSNPAWQY